MALIGAMHGDGSYCGAVRYCDMLAVLLVAVTFSYYTCCVVVVEEAVVRHALAVVVAIIMFAVLVSVADCRCRSDEAQGHDPIKENYITDLGRSMERHANSAQGKLWAVSTSVKLFDFAWGRLYDGVELMAFQGFHIGELQRASPLGSYNLLNTLAG